MRYRHAMMLFSAALPLCVLLRTIQLIFTIDDGTGFIKQQYSGISTIMMVVIYVAVATTGAVSFAADGIKAKNEKLKPVMAVISALTGGMFLFDTVTAFSSYESGSWHGMLLMMLGFASAVVFVAYGIKNIYHYNMPSMTLIIPVFYHIIRLINIFVGTSSLALTAENILLLVTNGALMLFMFEFAKFENNIDNSDKKTKKFLGIGMAAAMLCGVSGVPKLVILFFGEKDFAERDLSSALLMVALGAYVITFIICNFSDKEKAEKSRGGKHLAQ